MILLLQRKPTDPVTRTTFGDLEIQGMSFRCRTLEDRIRQTGEAKVYGQTAVEAMTYDLGLINSPTFGPDTIHLLNVPMFDLVYIHSGEDIDDTLGCIIVGDRVDVATGRISGGKSRGVLVALKLLVVPAIKSGEKCHIIIKDPLLNAHPRNP